EDGIVRATWADQRVEGDLAVTLGEGSFTAALDVSSLDEGLRLEVPEFRATRLDLPALPGERASGTLSVQGDGEMVWAEGGFRRADVEAVLETARWGAMVLDTGRAVAPLRGDDLRAEARLVTSAGLLDLEAAGRPLDPVRSFTVERLRVSALDLAQAGEGLPVTDIDAVLELEGSVPEDPALASARGVLTVAPSTIGPEQVDTATVRLSVDRGVLALDGEAALLAGAVQLAAGGWPLDSIPSFRLDRLAFQGLRPDTSWAGPLPLELSGVLSGEGVLPPEALPTVTMELALDSSRVGTGTLTGGRIALGT